MKIAIVAPSPVPYCIGGAENLWWGLLNAINQNTPHHAELIKLPSPEAGFWPLMASYRKFFDLDLTHFDRLISTKYPAWMVNHERHTCYLQHRLRGLYDTYHFTRLPLSCDTSHRGVVRCQELMRRKSTGRSDLGEFFALLESLREDGSVPKEVFAFPGPFAREVVRFLDGIGLSRSRIANYAAISRTVAHRKDYFPLSANVEIINHPSNLSGFRCGADDYLFSIGRLDGAKRIGLLVEAMRFVKSDIRLKIAGIGPEEDRLKKMADGDPRIEFLGFVNDGEVVGLYANALAVVYVPYDEDYGLVTIEAMMSAKPVLSVTDAGGATEFVRDGQTGFCVAPKPKALAERIDYLCSHRSECRRMGLNGRGLVVGITWEDTVSRLLGESEAGSARKVSEPTAARPPNSKGARQKMVLALTFPVYPPRGGGQSRVFHLYRNLANRFDIEIVSFCSRDAPPFCQEIAPGLKETRIPKSATHQDAENKYSKSVDWAPVTDIVIGKTYRLTPAYVEALSHACKDADIIVASHPYLIEALTEAAPDSSSLWLEAHNVEYELKRQILPHKESAQPLLELVREAESRCWTQAEVVFACTREDLKTLESLYGPTGALTLEVPNGVSLEDVMYAGPRSRAELKRRIGAQGKRLAIFMGSWHGPNLEAVERIFDFASAFAGVSFLIVGSAASAFKKRAVPENVIMAGVVDDDEKSVLLGAADVALNPMVSGSGSNLKMLDYFAAGVPVVSTPFGARGMDAKAGVHYVAADMNSFILELAIFLTNPAKYKEMTVEARKLAESTYSWGIIAESFYERIRSVLPAS